MLHTQTRLLENGIKGMKKNSNHTRDFADVTDTIQLTKFWLVVYEGVVWLIDISSTYDSCTEGRLAEFGHHR
jgi:hypothetical protein